ncbi:unnamed protein product, partial [Ectocarpus sp. 12 AP-2014]
METNTAVVRAHGLLHGLSFVVAIFHFQNQPSGRLARNLLFFKGGVPKVPHEIEQSVRDLRLWHPVNRWARRLPSSMFGSQLYSAGKLLIFHLCEISRVSAQKPP